MDDILEKLPEEFNMAEITQKTSSRTPYVLVCFQECERMNILLQEIRVSLQQLDLGLKVSLKVGLEQVFTTCEDTYYGAFFSVQGGADVISWRGSPADCVELRHGTRLLEQTGLSIHLRPGPVVSYPVPAPTGLCAGADSVFWLITQPHKNYKDCALWLYSASVQTTTSFIWASLACCFKSENQLKVRIKARFKFCLLLTSYLILDKLPDLISQAVIWKI